MNLNNGIDISIPFRKESSATSAWYVDPIEIKPVQGDGFIGSVAQGGSVNFNNLTINPHGNGTHTECVGHIAPECFSVNQHLKQWFFDALLITIYPENISNDKIMTLEQFKSAIGNKRPQALIIRTMPNTAEKLNTNYSNSNPPYLQGIAAAWLAEIGIEHLLIDLPSVDREEDGGELAAHHAFWQYPKQPRMEATITELIYVPNEVRDGDYWLNLQVAPIENDASPSRPVLYPKD
ncbi:MAG: cyclase family protein [Salibacteraceae bacterium]